MSTNANIIIKVKDSDLGKKIKFNLGKLPIKFMDWEDYGEGSTDVEKSKTITLNKPYISIYCHWDGYPSGVGAVLKKYFGDYETALNLIAGGSCSSIDSDGVRHYANRRGEEWKWLKPSSAKKPMTLAKNEYAYLFDSETDEWLVCDCWENKKAGFNGFNC